MQDISTRYLRNTYIKIAFSVQWYLKNSTLSNCKLHCPFISPTLKCRIHTKDFGYKEQFKFQEAINPIHPVERRTYI